MKISIGSALGAIFPASFVLLVLLLPFAAPAFAQTSGLGIMTRGSAMIFPFVDFASPARTLVTITNTNTDRTACPASGFLVGDVVVYVAYFDGADCALVADAFEALAPRDTLTFRAEDLVPGATGQGWMYAEARDPETLRPIDFDFLIGSVNLGDQHSNMKWWYGAYSFLSFRAEEGSPFGTSACGHGFTGSEPDNFANFNGSEYASFPETVYLDFFPGEGAPPELSLGATIDNRLVLVSPGGERASVTALVYDNDTHRHASAFLLLDCFLHARLSSISSGAREENLRLEYDASELGGLPYGWLTLSADRGMLGCFVQRVIRADGKPIQGFGRPLHFSGEKPGVNIRRGD